MMRPEKPVLVVDDDEALREAMTAVLETEGFHTVGAADGQEAIDLLRGGVRPCVILLDLMMPRLDGEAFRRIQLRDDRMADVPVIVFSARPDAERIARSLGATAAFRKPFDIEDALQAVEHYCRD
jgi:two-component system response regulator MprA